MMNFSEELFKKHKKEMGKLPIWLEQIQNQSFQKFQEMGFPTTQQEEWRFTNVEPIAKTSFALPEKSKLNGEIKQTLGAALFDLSPFRLVFVNDYFSPEHSLLNGLPEGIQVGAPSFSSSLGNVSSRNPFYFLNTAFFKEVVHISLPENSSISDPLHIVFVSVAEEKPFFFSPRVFISLGRNANAKIVQSYFGLEKGKKKNSFFNNAVTQIFLEENASLVHIQFQNEGGNSFHVSNTFVQQERNSRFISYALTTSGQLVRNDLSTALLAPGAECTLHGLYLVSEGSHVDNHTTIEHAQMHCTSRELYKGVLNGNSRAVFNGTIVVQPDAQKTDAHQTNKNLLLSDQALVHSKPELKIFANDVKCKHGATVGQMDANAFFYLRSRGIPQEESRKLLLSAFVAEVMEGMSIKSLIGFVNQRLEQL